MLVGRYSPLVSQAEITGKAHPDLHEFAHRKAMSGDTQYLEKAYPGGDHKEDYAIMPGELVIGRKKRAGHGSYNSRTFEAGFSSVARLNYGEYHSTEGLMRDFYFMGVAKGEYQPDGDSLFNTDPMDHGFGFLRAGSISINNNSPQDIHAGDIIGWRVPPTPGGDPRSQGNGGVARSLDTGLNPRVSYNRTGTPYGKPLIQIERFDPTDFSFQLAGAYALFDKPAAQGGINDLGPEVLFGDKTNLSSLQEEALGWKWSLVLMHQLATGQPSWNDAVAAVKANAKLGGDVRAFINNCFLRNVMPGENTPAINAVSNNYSNLKVGQVAFYRDNLFHMLCGSIAGAWYSKASRIIGKAMSHAKSTQTLDIMVSHFKCGF